MNKKTWIISRSHEIFIICLYRAFLDWCYFGVITKKYAYTGFVDNRNYSTLVLSWLILTLSFFFVWKIFNSRSGRNSELIVSALYLFSFVPFTTLVYAGLMSKEYILANCMYWFVLICSERIAMKLPLKRLPVIKLGSLRIDDTFVIVFGLLSMLLVLYISARYTHFRLNLSLSRVYDLRIEARTYKIPRIVRYLFAWTRAINPILLGYCLIKRKPWLAALYLFTQMLSFGIDGLKSTFFMPFLIIIIILFYRSASVHRIKLHLALGLVALTAISVLEYILLNSYWISGTILRRVLFVPANLGSCYFDFFQTHTPDFFRSSFLRWFGISSPYTENIPAIGYLIGSIYFGSINMNCNNGLISDAITNMGMLGLILMPIMVVYVIHLFERSTILIDKRLSAVIAVYIAYLLTNSFLATALLTHGVLLMIILFSMMDPFEYPTEQSQHEECGSRTTF